MLQTRPTSSELHCTLTRTLRAVRDHRGQPLACSTHVIGPSLFYPVACLSKGQSRVSPRTGESDLVAASIAVRLFGLPAHACWETGLGRSVVLELREDNAARAAIIRTGKNPATRHVSRTFRVQGACLTDLLAAPRGLFCPTGRQMGRLQTYYASPSRIPTYCVLFAF